MWFMCWGFGEGWPGHRHRHKALARAPRNKGKGQGARPGERDIGFGHVRQKCKPASHNPPSKPSRILDSFAFEIL